jgi:hypothetical protein
MTHGRNKYQSRENRARVREVLMQEWDPIGVRDAPHAQDEYDRYVGQVYVMLMDQRATEQAIATYLYDAATNYGAFAKSRACGAKRANGQAAGGAPADVRDALSHLTSKESCHWLPSIRLRPFFGSLTLQARNRL